MTEPNTDEYFRRATISRVIDGDTVVCDIDLGWGISIRESCRLLDVHAPEVRGKEKEQGLVWKAVVEGWAQTHEFVWVHSKKYQSGKYGRTLATIYSPDMESLNDFLKGIGS